MSQDTLSKTTSLVGNCGLTGGGQFESKWICRSHSLRAILPRNRAARCPRWPPAPLKIFVTRAKRNATEPALIYRILTLDARRSRRARQNYALTESTGVDSDHFAVLEFSSWPTHPVACN